MNPQAKIYIAFFISFSLVCMGCASTSVSKTPVVRVGHFPNITHAQAVIGRGTGWFARDLGKNIKIQWFTFNAGPLAVEAVFSGQVDIAYMGPNPAINGYIKSGGQALKIICGAAAGGAAFVIPEEAEVRSPLAFQGKRIGSPEYGSTQDVALRHWLMSKQLELDERGGNVHIMAIGNSEVFDMFRARQISGAWTVEPWVSRLLMQANGKVYFDEQALWGKGKYLTACVVARKKFAEEHPDIVLRWIRAHVKLTKWMKKNQDAAKREFALEFKREMGKQLPGKILDSAFSRVEFVYVIQKDSLLKQAEWAYKLGFLGREKPDVSRIVDDSYLEAALKENKN